MDTCILYCHALSGVHTLPIVVIRGLELKAVATGNNISSRYTNDTNIIIQFYNTH